MLIKRVFTVLLALCMIFALAACGAPASPATGTPAADAAPASGSSGNDATSPGQSVSQEDTIVLTYSYFTTEAIGPGVFVQQAAEKIAERSDGRLILDLYFNGTLLKTSDVISGCINGIADIVTVDQTIIGEVFPLSKVFSMPFVEIPPSKARMDSAFNKLIEVRPELGEELAAQDLMYLGIAPCGGYHLHGVDVLFDSPEKLVGYTIDGLGEGGNIITAMGGNGVTLEPGDWYLSLSTGLLDGQLTHFTVLQDFGLVELMKTHVIFSNSDDPKDYDSLFGGGIYAPMMGNLMNKSVYESLPADLQEIIIDEFSKFAEFITPLDLNGSVTACVDFINERGDQMLFIGDEELAPWVPGMQAIIDKWVEQVNALGYDGQSIYDDLLSLF